MTSKEMTDLYQIITPEFVATLIDVANTKKEIDPHTQGVCFRLANWLDNGKGVITTQVRFDVQWLFTFCLSSDSCVIHDSIVMQ